MDKQKLKERLLLTFVGELDEHAHTIERCALLLEKALVSARPDIFKDLFRAIHSLKGASRSVDQPLIEAVCHQLEDVLSGEHTHSDASWIHNISQTLLSTSDALLEAGRSLRTKEGTTDNKLNALLSRQEKALPPQEFFGATVDLTNLVSPLPSHASLTPSSSSTHQATSNTVKLPVSRLDALVSRGGEQMLARKRMKDRLDDLDGLRDVVGRCLTTCSRTQKLLYASARDPLKTHSVMSTLEHLERDIKQLEKDFDKVFRCLTRDQHALDLVASAFEDEAKRICLVPFHYACEGLDRSVHDLAQLYSKDVELIIEGGDIELDRGISMALRDPLLHLVRNAIDHGIEPAQERVKLGKRACGRILIRASLKPTGMEILVEDDGRGLDIEAITDKAIKHNFLIPKNKEDIIQMIFFPGFSTSREVTAVSGRGIGLDVVKHTIESLHGTVKVTFKACASSRFSITVPLTLTTMRALIVRAGGQFFAVLSNYIERLDRIRTENIHQLEGHSVIVDLTRDPISVVSLAGVLGTGGEAQIGDHGGKIPVFFIVFEKMRIAFCVDELVSEQDIVIKSLDSRLRHAKHFSGATVLPGGQIALILTVSEVIQSARDRAHYQAVKVSTSLKERGRKERENTKKTVILVVDDSITTRSMEKSILESNGYEVITACNGLEAWSLLQGSTVDLVVTDVEMPKMDGFILTEHIKLSNKFKNLPVVLVTALESDQDKARGLHVGADAYLPKSIFDQQRFLDVIDRLL